MRYYAIFARSKSIPGKILGYSRTYGWSDRHVGLSLAPRETLSDGSLSRGHGYWNSVRSLGMDAIYRLNRSNDNPYELIVCRANSIHCPASVGRRDEKTGTAVFVPHGVSS